MCTNSEPTIPSSFATSPFSIRWSKKARSSYLSFSSAAKVYLSSASANAALSERSANAISGSIIQNSARWRLVRVLRAEGRPEGVDLGQRQAIGLNIELSRYRQKRLAAKEILRDLLSAS